MTSFSSFKSTAIATANETAGVLTGVTVYDSSGELPSAGHTAGDQAFAGNRLYISNGSGWYNVGLVNLDPSIDSGPGGASYILDSNGGTATSITLSASDSDGTPIIWTYNTSDSANDLSTIINDSDGTFTITAKSLADILTAGYDSSGGSFTITFKASDGISFDTDSAGFSITYISAASFDVTSTVTVASTSSVTSSGAQGIEITQDGNYLLQADNLANIQIWPMSTPYDLSTTGSRQTDQYTGIGTPYNDDYIGGIRVSADLSQAFIANSAYARMIRFGQTPSNIDYPGHVSQTPNQTQQGNNIYLYLNTNNNFWDIAKDGSAFYGVTSNERLHIHKMSTAYDLNSFTGNPEGNVNLLTVSGVPSNSWNVTAVAVNDDGTRFWVGTNQNNIYQFDLSTANDYTTITYTGAYANGNTIAGLSYANGYLYVERNGETYQLSN